MERFVMDNKRDKIVRSVFMVIIIIFMCSLSFMKYAAKDALLFMGAGAVVALIIAVASFFGAPTVQITVNDTTVTISRNNVEESYKISDYDGPVVTMEPSGKSMKPVGSLVFDSGYKNLVKCAEFSLEEFRRISDAIWVRKYKMLPDAPAEEGQFEGSYKGSYTPTDGRRFILILAVLVIPVLVVAFVLSSVVPNLPDSGRLYMRCFYIFIAVSSLVACILMSAADKKSKLRTVNEIKADRQFLSINEESYEVAKIRELYMTQPYIKDALPAVRSLVFIYGDEKDPLKYMIEPRPDESIENDSDYCKLYNTVLDACASRSIRILEDEPRSLTYANPQAFRSRT